jgi:HPt (histidine-containing phosphotransfer) domain-containing protein
MQWVRRSCGGRLDVARRVAATFLDARAVQLESLDQALTGGDALRAAAAAHRLAGSVQTFRDASLSMAVRTIEQRAADGDVAGAAALLPGLRAGIERLAGDLRAWLASA